MIRLSGRSAERNLLGKAPLLACVALLVGQLIVLAGCGGDGIDETPVIDISDVPTKVAVESLIGQKIMEDPSCSFNTEVGADLDPGDLGYIGISCEDDDVAGYVDVYENPSYQYFDEDGVRCKEDGDWYLCTITKGNTFIQVQANGAEKVISLAKASVEAVVRNGEELAEDTGADTETVSGVKAPANGTVLADVTYEQLTDVLSGGDGFSILNNNSLNDSRNLSSLWVYDAGGNEMMKLESKQFDADCGVADLTQVDGHRLILTKRFIETPPQGLKAGQVRSKYTAWDPESGSVLWNAEIVGGGDGCRTRENSLEMGGFSATQDGLWAVEDLVGGPNRTAIFDLKTGSIRETREKLVTLGNFFAEADSQSDPEISKIVDPRTLNEKGTLRSVDLWNDEGWGALPGLARAYSDSDSPPVSITGNGKHVAAITYKQDDASSVLTAYRLPSGEIEWSSNNLSTIENPSLMGSGENQFFVQSGRDGTGPGAGYKNLALEASTGRKEWSVSAFAEICGATARQLLLHYNQQMIVLDAKSGKQISYKPSSEEACPEILPGGIQVDAKLTPAGNHIVVSQVLQP